MARTNGTVYRDYRKGKPGKNRRFSVSLLLFVLDIVMSGMLLLSAAATILCVITSSSAPEKLGIFSIVALGAPVIYIVTLIVLFYWIIRWKWSLTIVSLIFAVIGSIYIGRYYHIDFKQKPDTVVKNCLKVMSYNIGNSKEPALVADLSKHNLDIICLQEFLSDSKNMWHEIGDKYSSTVGEQVGFSCEILTKHKILRQGTIDSLQRYNAIWADIVIGEKKKADTIRVINLHLKSTTISAKDMQFVEDHQYVLDTARNSKIKDIADKLSNNNIARAEQARKIRRFIEQSQPKKIIVCGDFNDVPMSYSYNTIAEQLNDTFIAAGSGYRYTFNGFFNLMTIDYMLVSDHFDIISHQTDYELKHSDHYPIISRMKIKNN